MGSDRYARQIVLPEVGPAGQERLRAARVLCVGVGGLGSPVALYLAAAGVGTLGLVDDDAVSASNLQRQVLFGVADVGRPKVEVARERLRALNPDVRVEAHVERFTVENAERLAAGYDLIIDGTDGFGAKFLANDVAYRLGIPWVYGAVDRFEGQVALFHPARGGPCYRCLYPAPPRARVGSCAENGVLGAVAGVVGTLQATLALRWLISGGAATHPLCPDAGQLTVLELSGAEVPRSLEISKRVDCLTCSRRPEDVELRAEAELCQADLPAAAVATCDPVPTISAAELEALLRGSARQVVLLDVRTAEEWAAGRIPGAVLWPLARIEAGEMPPVPPGACVVAYCQSGARSARAAERLASLSSVSHASMLPARSLAGGIEAWPGPVDRA